jgi:hypothetical protein
MLQRPSYLQAPNAAVLAKAAAGLGIIQPPRISIADDRFTVVQANGQRHPQIAPALTLDVIVVGANNGVSQVYYDGPYDVNSPAAPACWSDNQIGPSKDAMQPQAETCAICPRAVWDQISANGNKVPACNQHKKLGVLVAGGGDTVYLLSIPPASLKVWKAYVAHVGSQGAGVEEIVTRLSIENKTLGFDPVDFIPEGAVPLVRKIVESDEADSVVGNLDRPRTVAIAGRVVETRQITQNPEDRQETRPTQPVSNAGATFGAAPASLSKPDPSIPTREELEAELARLRAKDAAPTAKTRTRTARQETVVERGAIPAGTFAGGQQNGNAGGFIGGQPEQKAQTNGSGFGIANAPPPDQAVQSMLDKAFGFPTK